MSLPGAASSRIVTSAVLPIKRLFMLLIADNMLQAAYLTIGKLAPDYENVELSVGGSTVAAAVVEATGDHHSTVLRNATS